jgi:outer membrane protein TolC
MKFRTAQTSLFIILVTLLGKIHLTWAAETSSSVKQISFTDINKLIMEKNEIVEASRKTLEAQGKRTGFLVRSFLPQISLNAGQEKFQLSQTAYDPLPYWRAEASLNIFRGGRDSLENDIRQNNYDLAKLNYSMGLTEELKEAQKNFFKILATNKLILEAKDALKKNESYIKAAQKRLNAGLATGSDTVQFELLKTSLEQSIKILELENDLSKNALSVALALDEHENIELEGDFPAVEMKSLKAVTTNNQIDIQIQKNYETSNRLRSTQNNRWWLPKVDLYTSYGIPTLSEETTRALNRDQEVTAGVRLSLDLGTGADDAFESSAKSLEAEAAQLRTRHKRREIQAQLHELEHDLKVMAQMLTYSDQEIALAQKFLDLTYNEYNRGVKNGPDLIAAFQKMYETRTKKIEYYQRYLDAKTDLNLLTADPINL